MGAASVVTVYDETATGKRGDPLELSLASEHVTVRDLIVRRVQHEVAEYNRTRGDYFRGLVAPAEAEIALNGYKMRNRKPLDPATESERALEAFDRNHYFMLIGDRQVESLDEVIVVAPGTEVRFVRLVPLVGG